MVLRRLLSTCRGSGQSRPRRRWPAPDVGLCFRLLWVIRESRHLFVPGCDSLALGPCESRGVKMGGGPPGSHSWLALPGALLEG